VEKMIAQEILRLIAAAVLGALIGLERERLDRGAGLRTHALVATASALIMIVSSYGFADVVAANRTVVLDPSRVAAQVVSGIGFLGAGLIILRRNVVYGLTTAASIWAVAAIGLAAGAGLFILATVTTGILLIILAALKAVEQRFFAHKRPVPLVVHLVRQPGQVAAIEEAARTASLEIWQLQLKPGPTDEESIITLELRGGHPDSFSSLVEALDRVPGVKGIIYSKHRMMGQESEPSGVGEDTT
jgi:putative Mg2+ transporter-C (MgtC) family protein